MHARATQGGVVLFIAMMVLLVLSLLGMIGATAAILENRMTASERNQQLARTAVMSALAEARSRVVQTAAAVGADQLCAELTCLVRDPAAPIDPVSFMQTVAAKGAAIPFGLDLAKLGGEDATARLATNAIYVIEDIGADPLADKSTAEKPKRFFRITASAAGGTSQYFAAGEVVVGITP